MRWGWLLLAGCCACSGDDDGGAGAPSGTAASAAGSEGGRGGRAADGGAQGGTGGGSAGVRQAGSGARDSGVEDRGGAGGTHAVGAGGNANGGMGGMSGAAGRAGSAGSDAGAQGSKLPAPPGASDQPSPSASGAPNLRVLPWAGFKAAASYTFDDSQPSHIAHFAAIEATGVAVTWYLNSGNNGLAGYDAAWKKALAAGHELGNHTVHHCNFDLSGCNAALASIDAEIDQCSAYIEETLGGPPVVTMAYPFGDGGYRGEARERFLLARGTGGGMVAFSGNSDPFDLPTKAAAGGEAAGVFNAAIDDARAQGQWVTFLFHSLLPGDNWYAGVEIASVTANIEYAKAPGDVWIDSVSSVGAYWLGGKAVAAATVSPVGAGMMWSWELPAHYPSGRSVRVSVDGGELRQDGELLPWNGHGYYEVALDVGTLAWSP
ncbi:MAG TPA: polysaccharide deacetylase family protein [Polyangiales bacterium]|nr:polysaccharide deacetylase family protein [Polyangiales bacterium]